MAAPLGLETKTQRGIFITYTGLGVGYGLLNEVAKRQGIRFNSVCAVLLQSLFKLLLATYMYLTSDTQATGPLYIHLRFMMMQTIEHRNHLLLYFIPSGLYVMYDVLSYVNLRVFDATTYFLLLQFRLVVTGVLHQIMFSKRLNWNQWISLGVTTLGCGIKTLGSQEPDNSIKRGVHTNSPTLVAYGLLMLQMLSSTFAGVYNEALLKKQASIPANLQNVFMYIDSIVCTLAMLLLGLTGQTAQEALTIANFSVLFSPNVLPMVLIMSGLGVVTSLFLKQLDSIRKAIASALELVFLPLLSAVFFSHPITLYTITAVCFVGSGVYIYSLPVETKTAAGLLQYNKAVSCEAEIDGANAIVDCESNVISKIV